MERRTVTTITANGATFTQPVSTRIGWCNKTRSKLLQEHTSYEDLVYSRLSKGLRKTAFKQLRLEFGGHIYFADIYIMRWNIIIEVDGGYHNSQARKEADKLRDELCAQKGIRVFRITNEQVEDEATFNEFLQMLSQVNWARKGMNPISDLEKKWLANPQCLEYGLRRRCPRIYEWVDGKYKRNSVKYLYKKNKIKKFSQPQTICQR